MHGYVGRTAVTMPFASAPYRSLVKLCARVSRERRPRHPSCVEEPSDGLIYEKYAEELTRFATGLVGPHDAADVVSMAVVRAFSSPAWAGVRDHRAYLLRSVLNETRMHHRSTLRRRAREARYAQPDRVEAPDVRPAILEQVAGLSVRQRAVVVLTYWDDLDPAEIGRRLGISPGSVRRHLARAHAHLRKTIHDER